LRGRILAFPLDFWSGTLKKRKLNLAKSNEGIFLHSHFHLMRKGLFEEWHRWYHSSSLLRTFDSDGKVLSLKEEVRINPQG